MAIPPTAVRIPIIQVNIQDLVNEDPEDEEDRGIGEAEEQDRGGEEAGEQGNDGVHRVLEAPVRTVATP